jgi:hypothetical protein
LALVLLVLVVTKLMPLALRVVGAGLARLWAPTIGLFTYPEYLITTLCRRHGWRLLPGTFEFGRLLGVVAAGGTGCGRCLRTRCAKPLRYPLKTTALTAGLLAGCWYLAPVIPPGNPQTMLINVNDDVVRVDSWLKTGQWQSAASPACSPRPKPQPNVKPKVKTTPKPTP